MARTTSARVIIGTLAAVACGTLTIGLAHAQGRPPPPMRAAPVGPPPTAKAGAAFDPTGQWVSLVTRDWRYRMVVPGRGEYQGVPMSLAGKQYADAWDPARDAAQNRQCAPYGAGVVMLVPGRLRIDWQDEQTLKVQTDAGSQTRILRFQPSPEAVSAPRSWQGNSKASWRLHQLVQLQNGSTPRPDYVGPPRGSLMVETDNLLGGLIRKNGLAYSDQATVTEYWEIQRDPVTQVEYLIVTARLKDPLYLVRDYFYTATFQRETDRSKWAPSPCTLSGTP